ncbi:MarR family winged helix-turn-helix transcriptional regulator [Aeromicrobium piscarium]|uniref:MarR family transcriptional regulator n=1 Tax=Aeromicrobium piscarium TaxID=2590901 RepID=A0A554SHC4_9ACTN|nr:MarR family transcriptional regulator [Aeromicrobium piscarium]TSD65751.1 MarR family transcriptional regulator [Aeromicrobium piscarium]
MSERDDLVRTLASDQLAIAMFLVRRDDTARDIPSQQLNTLFVIRALETPTAHDIALRLGVSAATMSGLLRRLSDRGYIERRVSSTDARARILVVTHEGERLLQEMLTLAHDANRDLLDRLDLDDLQALVRGTTALRRAAEHLDQ